ncbi:MAG: tetratricopeptide repeat protein [Bacteroidetes bacterium]|nr:tetratricopeptide repeat protein [Bacteroidota bacterium]
MPSSETIDALLLRLQHATNATEAQHLTREIWQRWMQHDDPKVRLLMQQGVGAMERKDFTEAEHRFSIAIAQDPSYAEAWNKRATVRCLQGTLAASVRDIEETLTREPRHFGALSGLGTIRQAILDHRGALAAFERVLEIHPHAEEAAERAEALRELL